MAISQAALLCLALNVYHEARGESLSGQKAVAAVTINRARENESSVCEEVFRPHQFSWTSKYRGKPSKKMALALKEKIREPKSWTMAKDVAKKALTSKNRMGNALYFHAKHVRSSRISKKLRLVAVIGNHKFYAERDG